MKFFLRFPSGPQAIGDPAPHEWAEFNLPTEFRNQAVMASGQDTPGAEGRDPFQADDPGQ